MGDFIIDLLGRFFMEFLWEIVIAPLFGLIFQGIRGLWRIIFAGVASIFNRDCPGSN